jgi:hypothetical protein
MTDNVATLEGFTRAVIADSDEYTLFLLVRPETDFGERFKAWDTDAQEFVRVNGWLFTVTDEETS